jgi:hypothetical protein
MLASFAISGRLAQLVRSALAVSLLAVCGAPALAQEASCVFSQGERLAALESLASDLRNYIESGGLYPASLRQLPAGVLGDLPPPLAEDTLWLWPPAAAKLGDEDRLMQGNYVSATCAVATPACGSPTTSVCYVLIDGAGSFCEDSALELGLSGCDDAGAADRIGETAAAFAAAAAVSID